MGYGDEKLVKKLEKVQVAAAKKALGILENDEFTALRAELGHVTT